MNLDKPLPKTILIRQNRVQSIQYEWINQLCFCYGHIGHQNEVCPFVVRAPSHSSSIGDDHLETFIGSPTTTGGETFGEWMVVSRKKKPTFVRKSGATDNSGFGRDVSAKVDLNSNPSSSMAPIGHREGKRKTIPTVEKVDPSSITPNMGRRKNGKGKLVNNKTTNPKNQSDPNSLV